MELPAAEGLPPPNRRRSRKPSATINPMSFVAPSPDPVLVTHPACEEALTLTARPESPATLIRRVWGARALVVVLARREFFVRYKRAIFGVLWAVALPAIQATVMVIVFSRIVRIHTDVPYITFVFAGMTAWSFFSSALVSASTAIVDGQGLSSKIYFPRAVLPLMTIGASMYGLAIGMVILLLVDLADTHHVGIEILHLVWGAGLLIALAVGFGLVTSAIQVYFRDMRYVLQASLFALFYITPNFYPVTLVSGPLRVVVLANPVTGIIELFRAATVGAETSLLEALTISIAWTVALITFGVFIQARLDRRFTDLL